MAIDGFVLVDKAGGWTSHDVVARVRRLLGTRKVGHAGTLDPMATGLLVLGVGRATRLLRFIQGLDKEYEAQACFGVATDSLDADGTEVSRTPMPITESDVRGVLPDFIGSIPQIPPMVSAKKVGGKRLYELARAGETVDRPPVIVEIHELEVTGFEPGDYPVVSLRVTCGSGTYIRSLADDIARKLGGRAHLTALRRTGIGHLGVDSAIRVDGDDPPGTAAAEQVLPMAAALAHLPAFEADASLATKVSHGQVLPLTEMPVASPTRVLDSEQHLIAIYTAADDVARPEVVLA